MVLLELKLAVKSLVLVRRLEDILVASRARRGGRLAVATPSLALAQSMMPGKSEHVEMVLSESPLLPLPYPNMSNNSCPCPGASPKNSMATKRAACAVDMCPAMESQSGRAFAFVFPSSFVALSLVSVKLAAKSRELPRSLRDIRAASGARREGLVGLATSAP
jgi:hypothetical protein